MIVLLLLRKHPKRTLAVGRMVKDLITVAIALLQAQICTICFHTCTQIFGIHKALMHVLRYKLSMPYSCVKSSTC